MNQPFLNRFPGQLKHWGFHCTINALPSFIIAAAWMKMYQHPACIFAMLLAILCFVLTYASLTSLPFAINESDSLTSRSMRLGAKIRSWIAGLSIPFVCIGEGFLLFVPDFWCGLFSMSSVNWIATQFGYGNSVMNDGSSSKPVAVFFTTLLEGTMLSIILLMIAFFSLIILQAKARRKISDNKSDQMTNFNDQSCGQ